MHRPSTAPQRGTRALPLPHVSCLYAALALVLCGCAHAVQPDRVATIDDPSLDEISGIAASRLQPGAVWVLEDGGNPTALFGIDRDGRRRAQVEIVGVRNIDWEALAPFQWQGRPHLLIADVGDNDAVRGRVLLHAVPEPATLQDASVAPTWTMELVWSDGPRDCEGVAVDMVRGEILLVSKRTSPPQLYIARLPAGDGVADGPLRAEWAAPLAGVPVTPEAEVRANPSTAWRHQPTGIALSPDGRRLAVLSYTDILLYTRRGDDSWAEAVSRAPRVLPLPAMRQAEAITWSAEGERLLISGEQAPAAIHTLKVPAL